MPSKLKHRQSTSCFVKFVTKRKLMTDNNRNPVLLRDVENGICTLTLNRPNKRNALSSKLLGELQSAFNKIASDKSIKVIILAANGPIFSSGHDLKELRKNSDYSTMHDLFSHCLLYTSPSPRD